MPLQAKPMGGALKGPPPPNKKYANVKARLDTGHNELKIKSSETKANARFHKGENFRRLKVHSLRNHDAGAVQNWFAAEAALNAHFVLKLSCCFSCELNACRLAPYWLSCKT